MRTALIWLLLSGVGGSAQVQLSFDSIAGVPWEAMTLEHAGALYPEQTEITRGPSGRAYLLGGTCISIPGFWFVKFSEAGVVLVFSPPDSIGRQVLKSITVSKRGAVILPKGIDIGDRIMAMENSDGTKLKPMRNGGGRFIRVFDEGVFYDCRPASIRRAQRGKPIRVYRIHVRGDY